MAEMIPDTLPASSTAGERRVFATLARLPDDCLTRAGGAAALSGSDRDPSGGRRTRHRGTQIDIFRSVIHPEVVIRASETDLAVLDLRQERNARALGDGHRIVYGVAGSGKTVLLIARAKLLAEDPEKRILVLCYNRLPAQRLAVALAGHRHVTVTPSAAASISERARRTAPSASGCLPDCEATRACAAATMPY
jgi:hypothetical protein